MAGGYNLVDEGRPVVGPLLLENGHQDKVELVQQSPLRLQRLLGAGALYDKADNKIPDT